MSNQFITEHCLREYLSEAINIFIASAYLSRAVIDDIKANLKLIPQQGGRNFKFLLSEDFHKEPMMRQVLINQLLELPRTEVRVYHGPKTFHPKVYIYENGNNMYTAVGSFNATAGGGGGNVEAGIRTDDVQTCRDAKAFFEKFWESEDTSIEKHDPTARYVDRGFSPGDLVKVVSTGESGAVLSCGDAMVNDEWIYLVFVSDGTRSIGERDLCRQAVAVLPENTQIAFAWETDPERWVAQFALEKVIGIGGRKAISAAASRTRAIPYQFRPLMQLLRSPDSRLILADEVGLGKTIEAGIILKELVARGVGRNVLIVSPNSLKYKWQEELRQRFDEYFDLLEGADLVSKIRQARRMGGFDGLRGIITYSQLCSKGVQIELNGDSNMPALDLLIVDEAHHLKNPETIAHRTVKKNGAAVSSPVDADGNPDSA